MTTLKSMTQYVLEQDKTSLPLLETDWNKEFETRFKNIVNYAKFLSMPLELKMFVPVDEYGSIMKEPTVDGYMQPKEIDRQYEAYQKAKAKVIFEGFDVKSKTAFNNGYEFVVDKNEIFYPYWRNPVLGWEISKGLKTIEDLVKLNLTLTTQCKEKYKF